MLYRIKNKTLLKTAVPEFKNSALLGQNSRDIFFSPNGGRTGTAVLISAKNKTEKTTGIFIILNNALCLHFEAYRSVFT